MIDDVQKRRFHKLRFDDRRLHRKDRLPGENHGAFGDRRNIAGKTEIFQIFQKSVVKQTQAFQVFKFLFSEGKVFDIRHRLFQPDGERIGDHAVLTEKNIEYGDLLFPALFEIPVHHRQLVQIRKQRQIPFHNKMLLKGNGNRKAAVSQCFALFVLVLERFDLRRNVIFLFRLFPLFPFGFALLVILVFGVFVQRDGFRLVARS